MEDSKKTNQTRILEYIFRNGPVSRTVIAENTNINSSTVTNLTKTMLDLGIIQVLGEDPNDLTPGRKQILIDINPDYACAVGVEFNENQISFCITNLGGKVLAQKVSCTTAAEVENITDFLIQNIDEISHGSLELRKKIVAIGIAMPGKLNRETNRLFDETGSWKNFEPERLRERFHCPVVLENNVKCMACGYYLFKREKTPETFSFFHLGKGIYCATIRNGEMITDENYIIGEIGHTIVNVGGQKCSCGKYGCLHTLASERWLLKTARLWMESSQATILKQVAGDQPLTIEHLIMAYKLGDPIVEKMLNDAMKYLSVSISNLFIMLNPTKIFLHGKLFDEKQISDRLFAHMHQDLTYFGNNYSSYIEIVPCNGLDGAIGASAKAIRTAFIDNI